MESSISSAFMQSVITRSGQYFLASSVFSLSAEVADERVRFAGERVRVWTLRFPFRHSLRVSRAKAVVWLLPLSRDVCRVFRVKSDKARKRASQVKGRIPKLDALTRTAQGALQAPSHITRCMHTFVAAHSPQESGGQGRRTASSASALLHSSSERSPTV